MFRPLRHLPPVAMGIGLTLLGVLIYISAGTYAQAEHVLAKVEAMAETPVQFLETTWTSAGPMTQKVHTDRDVASGESDEQLAARHAAAVAALKSVYPPV